MAYCPKRYIYFWSTRKVVQPYRGYKPTNDSYISLHSIEDDLSNQFRFVPKDGAGHFGYIEHVSSGMVVHPSGGELIPGNNTYLVLHHDRHAGALFAFDEEDKRIIHKGSGKIWHSRGGPNPKNDTCIVLHSDVHDAAKFYFGDVNARPVSPHPPPTLYGGWELIKIFSQPTMNYTYKVGRMHTTSVSSTVGLKLGWKISAADAVDSFSASPELCGLVEKTTRSTWIKAEDETLAVTVEPGKITVVWQFLFGMTRYGEVYVFYSSITGNTDSLDVKPSLEGWEP